MNHVNFLFFRDNKIYLIGGSIPETCDGKLFNTSTGKSLLDF